MSPDTVTQYLPCLWCGKVYRWQGFLFYPYDFRGQQPTMGRACRCLERHEAMVKAGIER